MTKLERLEKKMTDGFGKISTAEGLLYLFEYVQETIRVIKKLRPTQRRR